MPLNYRLLGSLSFFSCIVAAANAYSTASGTADTTISITSIGSDITMFTEPEVAFEPTVGGPGIYGNPIQTTTPVAGGVEYITSSFATLPTYPRAYEESVDAAFYLFANTGSVAETVTMSYIGSVSASASASGANTPQSYDYAESFVEDAEVGMYGTYAFDLGVQSYSGGPTSIDNSSSGSYTFTVGAGVTGYEIYAGSYNEATCLATPEPGSLAVLGLGVLPLLMVRRRNHVRKG